MKSRHDPRRNPQCRQLDQGTRTARHTFDGFNWLDLVKNAAGDTLSDCTFDTRGNLTQRVSGPVNNPVIDTFTFDKANRLKATTINGVASTYRYDGLGRRMQQIEAGVSSYFVYGQAGQLLFSQDGVNRYNHIHLAGSLVAKRTVPFSGTPASVRYQHTDALGSPVAETSETGTVTRRERMTAYGEPADGTWQSGPGFTGHQMDATSRLVYMQQRYYDPVSGRFLSGDPLSTNSRTGNNFSRYWYGNNNPYRFADPDGREGIAIRHMERDIEAMNRGEMSRDEFMDRSEARGWGAIGGAAIVATGSTGVRLISATPFIAKYLARQEAKREAQRQIRAQATRGIRSLEKRIAEHERKLEQFKNEPTVRPGMEGMSPEAIQAQQAGRIEHLETEIKTFRENIEKLKKVLGK